MAQEAGWAPGPVWTGAENLAPPPGFDFRTVQPVASRYTDYATRPTEHDRNVASRYTDWAIPAYTHKCTVIKFTALMLTRIRVRNEMVET
jgi:hypothetical protein